MYTAKEYESGAVEPTTAQQARDVTNIARWVGGTQDRITEETRRIRSANRRVLLAACVAIGASVVLWISGFTHSGDSSVELERRVKELDDQVANLNAAAKDEENRQSLLQKQIVEFDGRLKASELDVEKLSTSLKMSLPADKNDRTPVDRQQVSGSPNNPK